jgi:hypothetical protein
MLTFALGFRFPPTSRPSIPTHQETPDILAEAEDQIFSPKACSSSYEYKHSRRFYLSLRACLRACATSLDELIGRLDKE